MIQELQLRLLPQESANEQAIKQYIVREKGFTSKEITAIRRYIYNLR